MLLAACVAGRLLLPGTIDLLLTRGDGLAFGCFLAWLLAGDRASRVSRRQRWCLAGMASVGGAYVAAYLVTFRGDPHPGWQATSFTGFSMFYCALIGICVCSSGRAL